MGQLTNLYVSESYQGLIKLANSTTGVTSTLQYTQDGVGNNLPLQISTSSVNITGSFTVNGQPVQADTGSLVSTASFNAYTSSNDSKVNSLIAATGSYVTETESGSFLITGSVSGNVLTFTKGNGSTFPLTVNTGSLPAGVVSGSAQVAAFGYATTSSVSSSVATLSGSIATTDLAQNNRLTSIEGITGSLATTSSLTSLSQSIAVTDLGQNNRLGSLETTTGSLQNQINQKLDTGSFNSYTSSNDSKVNSLIASTGSYATTSSLTSLSQSIALTDLNQNNTIAGLATTSSVNTKLDTGSFNSYTSSNDGKVNSLINATGSYATTGSNVFQGLQTISGSLIVTGSITALSASITYLQTVYQTSSVIFSSGSNILGDEAGDSQTLWGTVNLPTGPLTITGSLHSTNIIGTGSLFLKPNQADARFVEVYNTSPTDTHITASGGQIFLGDDQTYVKVDNYGSVERIDIVAGNELVISSSIVNVTGSLIAPSITGSLQGTASYATNALSASYAPQDPLPSGVVSGSAQVAAFGFATTGSNTFIGNQTVTGSFNISGSIFMVNGSDLVTHHIKAAGSNGLELFANNGALIASMGAGGGTQANFTGSLSSTTFTSPSITGSLQGTASYAVQALSASYAPGVSIPAGTVSGSAQIVELGFATTSSVNQKLDTGSFNSYTSSMDARTGSYITTGSAASSQSITGSVNVTGSLYEKGNLYVVNPNMTNTFNNVSSSYGGNLLFGWDGITTQASSTSSYVISGSNNILRVSQPLAGAGYYNYISGSNNISLGGIGIILSTGSVLRPATSNNTINGAGQVTLTFISSSVAGGQPSISNNIVNNSVTINMGASGSITATGNIINGATSIYQTGSAIANLRSTFNNNNINSTFFVQNYLSSSFTVSNNNTVGASHYIENNWVNGFGTVGITASRNFYQGQANFITFSGSSASNTSRAVSDNFLGGNTVNINSSASGSAAGNAYGTIIYGYNLQANANSTGIFGGSAFFGRFNDTGSIANTNDIVFAVGTGTAAGSRRTGLYVTSGSLVGVSGSLQVIGNTNIAGTNNTITSSNLTIISSSFNQIYGETTHSGSRLSITVPNINDTALQVGGVTLLNGPVTITGSETLKVNRIHFDGNPFNADVSSNLGAIRLDSTNTSLQYTNYDRAEITTRSFIDQTVITGSLYTETKIGSNYAGTSGSISVKNTNGVRLITIDSDSTTITGSLNVTAGITGSLQGTASYASQALTASFALNAVSTDTGSLMKTGSVASNVLTFTKGDGSTFNLTVATGSGGGSSFPYTGSAIISGSLTVTGSMLVSNGTNSGSVITNQTDDQSLPRVNNIVTLTSAEYNTMATASTLDANTLYVVSGSAAVSPFPYSGNAIISGSLTVTGSLNVTAGITGSLQGTASYATNALTASFALNGGGGSTFPFTGSAVISGSLAVTGSLGVSDKITSPKMFNYGQFISTSDQTVTDTTSTVTFDSTVISSNVTLSGSTQIVVLQTGVYNFTYDIQIKANNAGKPFRFWINKNASAVANTTRYDAPKSTSSTYSSLTTINYTLSLSANDVIELLTETATSGGSNFLDFITAAGGSTDSPSVTLSVSQIS